MCVLGPGDHSTHIYEVGVGGILFTQGPQKMGTKEAAPPPTHTQRASKRVWVCRRFSLGTRKGVLETLGSRL